MDTINYLLIIIIIAVLVYTSVKSIKLVIQAYSKSSEDVPETQRNLRRHRTVLLLFIGAAVLTIFLASQASILDPHPSVRHGLTTVAIAIGTVFSVHLLLELEDVRKYYEYLFGRQLIQALVYSKEFLKEIPKNRLEAAHANIIKILNGKEFNEQDNSFYIIIRQQVESLIGRSHLDRLTILQDQRLKNNDGIDFIESSRTYTFEYHTRNDDELDLCWDAEIRLMPGFNLSDYCRLEWLEIDGDKIITTPVALDPVPVPGSNVRATVKPPPDLMLRRNLEAGQRLMVKRKELYLLPIDDFFAWTVGKCHAVKRLSVKCKFLNANAFPRLHILGFLPQLNMTPPNPIENERDCEIEWEGMMVPSQGFLIKWDVDRASISNTI